VLPRVEHLFNVANRWPSDPRDDDGIFGARPIYDGGAMPAPTQAIARAILHTNLQIAEADALLFADETVRAARANELPPEFLAATLLQESAYDPRAFSSAGAIGVGQFTFDTAQEYGVDPFDPDASIAGAAELLGDYARAYRRRFDDPLSMALAAYNAGPGAVEQYDGIPPYAETREYVDDIFDREARIFGYEIGSVRRGGELFGE
jgi:soluble lytic murein transglycosylase-like protein